MQRQVQSYRNCPLSVALRHKSHEVALSLDEARFPLLEAGLHQIIHRCQPGCGGT